MLTSEVLEKVKELRTILGQIKGCKNVQEGFSLNYVLTTENEEGKHNAEEVTSALANQCETQGLEIDFIVVTEEELEEVRKKAAKHLTDQSTFKA